MQTDTDLQSILNFLKEVRKLQITYRFTPKPDGGFENDAEHSWAVALSCMLLAKRLEKELGVKLDELKMLKMALVHDLAEIETGDTKTWDTEARVKKQEKERIAINSLMKDLPHDLKEELLELWEECEAKESLEAKIVKSIDRFDPVIHRTVFAIGWKEQVESDHATREALDDRQLPRHSFSKTLTTIYERIRDEAVEKDMFKR